MRALGLLALVLLAAPASAQPTPRRADGVVPTAKSIYAADDPDAALKMQIERLMGVYLVDPPRRHASEKVVVKGDQVQIDVWHPVSRLSDTELKTRAVHWFVLGRTQYAPGVRGVFSELPQIDDARLVFHEVLRPDARGRRRGKQRDQVKPYLVLRLDRRSFEKLAVDVIEKCVERGDCSALFDSAFKYAKFDRRYVHRARKRAQ